MTDRLRQSFQRFLSFFRATQLDRDLDAEISAHLELAIEEHRQGGMSPEEARRQALIQFGGIEQTKQSHRDSRGVPYLEIVLQDLRFAVRRLLKSPGFTCIVVLTIALGIGANTTIFSMVNALLLHPYPFHKLDSLVMIWESRGTEENFDARWISPADAKELTKSSQLFTDLTTFKCQQFNLSSEGRIDATRGCRVSANFFQVLGVSPAQGRAFSKEEDRPGSIQVAVVSHAFWQSKFGGDPTLLGKTIRLSGRNYTVIGIMPQDFDYPVPMELWVPLALSPAEEADRGQPSLAALGRLRDRVSVPQARAELDALSRRLSDMFPNTNSGRSLRVLQLRKELYLYTLPLFSLMQAAAAFLLLLVCANLANLLFARMIARHKELAVRSALGASQMRLARLLTAEILLLLLLGGSVSVASSFSSVRILRNSISPEWTKWVPGWDGIQVDRSVLAFAILLSVALGLLFVFVIALNMRRIDLNKVLKQTGRGSITLSRGRLRNALVSAQMTLALVLLVCAGLTIQGFNRLTAVYQGFQPDHVLKFEVALPDDSYADNSKAMSFFHTALREVSALPGVSNAALATNLPASNVESEKSPFTMEGLPPVRASEAPSADLQVISEDYFAALRVPLIAGRFFTEADNASAAPVVIISQSMASRFWVAGNALGRRFKLGPADSKEPWVTVVGVVGDARQNWWQPATLPVIYQPYLQSPNRTFDFVMRVSSDPASYASAARGLFSQLDAGIAVTEMNSLETEVQDSIAIVQIMGILMGIFGAIALLLSSIGLYGILSENIAQRTNEFGIRLALGAHPRKILNLALCHAMTLVGIGLAIGFPLALAAGRAMAAYVFGIVSVSLPGLAALACPLVVVALAAAYLPARRATRVDPMIALRYE